LALVKAYSQKNLAEAATKRAEQLVAADVIGRAELERRQAELLQASTEAASYRTQLHGLGMSDVHIQKLVTTRELSANYSIVTLKGGIVLERKVTIGQVVQPAYSAFTIADLSSVWIVANVPEEDAGLLRQGMEVVVRIPALLNQTINGHLSYVAPIVDPATRTVQVRMDVANPQRIYRPDELASMTFTGTPSTNLPCPRPPSFGRKTRITFLCKPHRTNFYCARSFLAKRPKTGACCKAASAKANTLCLMVPST
jgi:cobalt-zinc-cadmium efflux system membrane fusion protein